jgi:hypothetical protein
VYLRQLNAGLADLALFAVFFYGVALSFLLSAMLTSVTPRPAISIADAEVSAMLSLATALASPPGESTRLFVVELLMWGATIPTVYCGFSDASNLHALYCIMVSFFLF